MKLLAIETSTELCSAAILRNDELFLEEAPAENRHSELLMPMIRRLLDRSGLHPREMDAFAFGQGPGSFTGIRIACGVIQGLAFATERPVVAVPSLLALAEQSRESRVIAALDARMDEAYLAAYARSGGEWDEVVAPCLADRAAFPGLPGRSWAATGSGFDRLAWLREAYREPVTMRIENDLPRAGAVARLGARLFLKGAAVAAERAAPLYLRDKVALTTGERLAKR